MLDSCAFGLRFHHLGLAVRQPDSAFACLTGLGYRPGAEAFDPLQNVRAAMRHHPAMPDIEVIWPGDGPSPIDIVLKRYQGLIYHICYETADPERSIAAMQEVGLRVIPVGVPKPAVLFGGREVAFYVVANFGMIELLRDPA